MDLNKATEIEKIINDEDIIISPYDTPWEIACMLINAKRTAKTAITNNEIQVPAFERQELKRLGEHLVNYCRTEEMEG